MGTFIYALFMLFLLTTSVFAVSRNFMDMFVETKWYATLTIVIAGVACAAIYMLFHPSRPCRIWKTDIFELSVVTVSTSQAVFFLMQYSGICSGYGPYTSGSFENTAGLASCVCFSLPLGWRWLTSFKQKRMTVCRRIAVSAFLLCKIVGAVAVGCSGSRTGLLCMTIMLGIYLLRGKKKAMLMVVPTAGAVTLVLMFAVKTDSSRGRWFIIQRTLELIARRPFTGWGSGGFDARYMEVQADYFAANPESGYVMLADNVRHPLNEFLLVTVNYGLVELAVVLAVLGFIIAHYLRHRSEEGFTGMMVMTAITTFSLFSYPFLYPFTWLMAVFAVVCIVKTRLPFRRTVCLASLAITVSAAWMIVERMKMSVEFCRLQDKARYGRARRMLPDYGRLYPRMKTDYRFLYNYAAMLYDAGHYDDALRAVGECSILLADYDVSLLRGDILREQNNHDTAIAAYRRAHLMCPNRFIPLYEMARIYEGTGRRKEAKTVAEVIVGMDVKVPSREVEEIKSEMKRIVCGR